MESKFKVGDKVVPVKKSVGIKLSKSINWIIAQRKEQNFLYVICYEDSKVVCSHFPDEPDGDGDYFLESDLIHYVEPKK